MPNLLTWVCCLFVFLSGCSFNDTDANRPFQTSTPLKALAGTYQNLGQSGRQTQHATYLSQFIWTDRDFQHQAVERIEVLVIDEHILQVSALGASGVIKTDRFIRGQHFNVQDGLLQIRAKAGVAGVRSGEPVVGVYSGKTSVGLDAEGHGKLRIESAVVGLAMALIPVAVGSQEDFRFVRLK